MGREGRRREYCQSGIKSARRAAGSMVNKSRTRGNLLKGKEPPKYWTTDKKKGGTLQMGPPYAPSTQLNSTAKDDGKGRSQPAR